MNVAPTNFYFTGGTMPSDAVCYVERQADRDLFDGLGRSEYCYVLTSRQMGKSSLMVRTAERLRQSRISTVFIDLTEFGQNVTVDQWYEGLLRSIGEQLEIEDPLVRFWQAHGSLGPLQRWVRALREIVLARVAGPLVLFVDEIDYVRVLPFSTDEFFAAIRECFNHRSVDADMARLTFCLLGVATPSDLIRDTRTTPFNIGRRIEMRDFSAEESAPLTRGLPRDEASASLLLQRILHWTGGHPYLTQRMCETVANDAGARQPADVDRICAKLFFAPRAQELDDNLGLVRARMLRSEVDLAGLLDLYGQVCRQGVRDDETNALISVLRLSGITRIVAGRLQVRNRIYERVFNRAWIDANMPDAEVRRQRLAFRKGVLRASGVATAVLLLVLSLGYYAWHESSRAESKSLEAVAEKAARIAADKSAKKLQAAQMEADEQRIIANERTARLHVEKGASLMENRDFGGAMAMYREAMKFEQDRPADVLDAHRRRLTTTVSYMPRLARSWTFQNSVTHAELSPDESVLATGGADGTVRVADAHSHKLLWEAKHLGRIAHIAFSNDGRRLVSAGADKVAKVWEVATGKLAAVLPHPMPVLRAGFSPGGERVLSCCNDSFARVWDVNVQDAGKPMQPTVQLEHRAGVLHGVFSADGKRVLTVSGDRKVSAWSLGDTKSGGQHFQGGTITKPVGERFQNGTVSWAASSPSGCLLVAEGLYFATVYYSPSPSNPLAQFVPESSRGQMINNQVKHVSISPDGRLILTAGGDGDARVWDARTGEPLGWALRHGAAVVHGSFAGSGRLVLTVCADRTVSLWDIDATNLVRMPAQESRQVTEAAVSSDGRRVLLLNSDGELSVYDTVAMKHMPPLKSSAGTRRAWLSGDGKRALALNSRSRLKIWDVDAGTALPGEANAAEDVHGNLSFTGASILAVDKNGPRLWHTQTGEWRTLALGQGVPVAKQLAVGVLGEQLTLPESLTAAAFTRDGACLATSTSDAGVTLWTNLAKVKQVLPATRGVDALAFSADGLRLVTVAKGQKPRVWSLSGLEPTAAPIEATPLIHRDDVTGVQFSPDGKRIVSTAGNAAWVWNTTAGPAGAAPIKLVHRAQVYHASFSPDGRFIVTGCADRSARVWDAHHGEPVTPPLQHPLPVAFAAFSADTKRVVTAALTYLPSSFLRSDRGLTPDWNDYVRGRDEDVPYLPYTQANKTFSSVGSMISAIGRDDELLDAPTIKGVFRVWQVSSDERLAVKDWLELPMKSPFGTSSAAEPYSAQRSADWHWHQIEECEPLGNWHAVRWHLDRLLQRQPDVQQALRIRRGEANLRLGNFDEALDDLQAGTKRIAVSELSLKVAGAYRQRADAFIQGLGRTTGGAFSKWSEYLDEKKRSGPNVPLATGDPIDRSKADYRKCAELLDEYLQKFPTHAAALQGKCDLVGSHARFAEILFDAGSPEARDQQYEKCRELLGKLPVPGKHATQAKKILANSLASAASKFFNRSDYKNTVAYCSEAIGLDPKNAFFCGSRAAAYVKMKENGKALQDYDRAILLDPKNAANYISRARFHADLKNVADAEKDYSKAIELNPASDQLYVERGGFFARMEREDEALEDFSEAIRRNPTSDYNYRDRGRIYLKRNDLDKAIADFQKAISLYGTEASHFNDLGRTYLQRKKYDEALANFGLAIRFSSSESSANQALYYRNRGLVHTTLKRHKEALADDEKAVRLNPQDPANFINRGIDHHNLKDYDKAIADYSEAVKLDPKNKAVLANRGNAWREKGDLAKAHEDYSEALRIDANYAYAYSARAGVWRLQKKYEKALADYNEAIRIDPKYVGGYFGRAMTWKAMKDYDKAIAEYTEMIRLDLQSAVAYNNRGFFWSAKKDYDKAIADYTETIRLDPKYAYAYNNRGIAQFLKKNCAKAIDDFDQSEKLDDKNAWVFKNRAKMLATCADPKYRDGAKAVELAQKALDMEKDPEPDFYATLAAAYAERGDFVEAVRWQEKALEAEKDADGLARLELYRSKKPYRQD